MAGALILDGKAMASRLREDVAQAVARLKTATGCTPGLAAVLVGEDPASRIYVRNKTEQTTQAGMNSFLIRLPADVAEADLIAAVRQLNGDDRVHGILVQLPLPPQVSARAVLETVDPAKDVDGFHVVNAGRLFLGEGAPLLPCTPAGCLALIRSRAADLAGKRALVLGRSNIVGKPMAVLLLAEHCTVTIAHSRTADLSEECRRADILVAAIGRPRFVQGSWIKEGAIVIDVGINRLPAGNGSSRLVGDVDFAAASAVAGAITPVPGGVGPMTVACLLRNTVIAAYRSAGLPDPVWSEGAP